MLPQEILMLAVIPADRILRFLQLCQKQCFGSVTFKFVVPDPKTDPGTKKISQNHIIFF